MERSLILFEIRGGQTVTNHHIRLMFQYLLRHLCRIFQRVGIVTVDHDIAECIDLAEHPADHIALALPRLRTHHCAGFPGQFRGTVRGIVVIDIDHRLRQSRLRVLYHFRYGLFLVITWN